MLRRLFKRVFSSPFRPLYDEARLLPKLRRSILFVIFGNVFGNLFGVITGVGGTALTGYAEALGAGDFVFGVLNGIPLAAALMQIPASMLVSRGHRRKRYMLTYGVFSRALWIVVGLVPFFTPIQPAWLRLWGVIFLVGISSVTGAFINVCFTPWLADLVPLRIRGRWISLRDGIIAAANVLVGLVTAFLLDNIPGFLGYAVVFVLGGVLGVLDMFCFLFVEEVYTQPPMPIKLFKSSRQIFQDKPFFRFMLFWTAWSFTANLASPFLGRYALSMGLSYMQLTLCGQIASALTTVSVVWLWGWLLDQYGSKPVLWVSCLLAALTPAFYLFSTPNNIWPTLLYNVIGAFFWSAANLTSTSMQLSTTPDDQRPVYIAMFSCFTSMLGSFLGVLSGGALLEWAHVLVDSGRLAFLGPMADAYKLVFLLSVVTRVGIVLLFVPRMENPLGYSVADMLRGVRQSIGLRLQLTRPRRRRR